jgi:two-component system sensor histidine kinase ChvG
MSIKVRVVLFLALLMLYPWSGVQYLRQSEKNIRALETDYLKDRIIDIGRLINFSFNSSPKRFSYTQDDGSSPPSAEGSLSVGAEGSLSMGAEGSSSQAEGSSPTITAPTFKNNALFFYPLARPPQVDGYNDEEWNDIPAKVMADQANNFSLSLQSGTYADQLFVRLAVTDGTLQRQNFQRSLLANGDYFAVRLGNNKTYYFRLLFEGRVNAYTLGRGDELFLTSDISAAWSRSSTGYEVEFSVSEESAAGRLGFLVVNGADTHNVNLEPHQGVIANLTLRYRQKDFHSIIEANNAPAYQFYRHDLAKIIDGFATPGMRLHVVDRQCNVLASAGQLAIANSEQSVSWVMKALYQRVLADQEAPTYARNEAFDCQTQWSERQSNSGVQAWSTAYTNDLVSYAAMPLSAGPYTGNFLIAEQSRDRYVMFTNKTFASYFYYTLGISLCIVLALSSYLFFWSWRLNRLNRQAQQQVDDLGDVASGFKASTSADEIGQLSRNVGSLLEQIRGHNDYLKTLAQKLSHEMKTPLAIVSTSLDNIDSDAANQVYLERAQDGVHRLSYIMSSMGQAKKLEQAFEYAEFETVDIVELLGKACEAYQHVYPHSAIVFVNKTQQHSINLQAASELLVQMLDKLVDNAVDFCEANTAINIHLLQSGQQLTIEVVNCGPLLAKGHADQLFQQLVSFREQGSEKPHLGLGLFVARLIAEHHKGSITASNLPDKSGVCFAVTLPL